MDKERLKYSFWGTFVFYMLAHAYACFNYHPIWDTVNHTFDYKAMAEAALGRYLRPIIPYIRGEEVAPWLITVISVICLVATTYMITEMLEFKRPVSIVICGGVLSANLSVTAIVLLHICIEDALMISLFAAILGVYLIWKRTNLYIALAPVCFFISFALYAAFSSTLIVMILILAFKYVYQSSDKKILLIEEFKRAWKYIIAVTIGIVLYICGYLLLQVCGFTFYSEQNCTPDYAFNMNFTALVRYVYGNVTELIRLFFVPFNRHSGGFGVINMIQLGGCILLVSGMAVLFNAILERKNRWFWFFSLLVLTVLIIVSSLVINIFAQHSFFHFRLIFAIFLIYFVFIGVIDEWRENKEKYKYLESFLVFAFSLVLFWNIRLSNDVYIVQQFSYERAKVAVSKIMDDIEDNYDMDLPIVLVGSLNNSMFLDITSKYEGYFNGLYNTAIGYNMIIESFMDLLGPTLNVDNNERIIDSYKEKPEIVDMPTYPQVGYHRVVDGRIVVKLGN